MEKPENRLRIPLIDDPAHNPCGGLCMPFQEDYCKLNNTQELTQEIKQTLLKQSLSEAKSLGKIALVIGAIQSECREFNKLLNLHSDSIELKDEAEFWKSIADNLAKDPLTGLYVAAGHEAILQELFKTETIQEYVEKGYEVRIVCVDINNLKVHNSGPGGHLQGDMAIQAVGGAINGYAKVSRRNNLTNNDKEDRRSVIHVPRIIASRIGGDEFLILSFASRGSRKSVLTVKEELDRLFSDLHYIHDGIRYNVSVTYGIGESKLTPYKEDLKNKISEVDVAMMDEKAKNKHEGTSSGIIVKAKNRINKR